MKRLRISQIQFEAKPTPLENAEILKRYFERTKKFNPNLICTPECSNIITNDLNFLKNNTTFEKKCPILYIAKLYAKENKVNINMATDLYKTIKITPKRETKAPIKQKAYRGFSTVNPESTSFQQFDISLIKQNLLNHFNIRQGEKLSDKILGIYTE